MPCIRRYFFAFCVADIILFVIGIGFDFLFCFGSVLVCCMSLVLFCFVLFCFVFCFVVLPSVSHVSCSVINASSLRILTRASPQRNGSAILWNVYPPT